jgi:predicted dienelactone hydrolase
VQPVNRLLRFLCALSLCALSLGPAPAWAADEQAGQIGGIDVVVWTPSAGARENLAVLMFSHALYMCPTQSRYLTAALADAGYLVIAPQHSDSACSFSLWPSLSRMSLKPSALWTDSDYRDRAEDIRTVVNALSDDPRYRNVADLGRLALVGHSLGGYTVLGLGGAWPSWQLPGVRAIVALTPYSMPFQQSEGLRHITAPIMYQAGTLDPIFTIPLEQFGYAQTPKPKYMVEIASASHMAWTDLGTIDRDAIIDYAIAFLDHYVKGAPEAVALHDTLPGVSTFLRD